MGLLSALSNAVSGLSVNQQQLNTLSQNISNANTANYSLEKVNQVANYSGNGEGQGVTVSSVTRSSDDFLTSQMQAQTSANGQASTIQSYYSQIENLMGQPGANNSIDSNITSFFTAVQSLANSPSVSGATAAVNAASTLSTQISGFATSLTGLQLQADTSIGTTVNSVNADLQSLQTVNQALEVTSATNGNPSGLLDQRDALITDMSQYMDITSSFNAAGQATVTAGSNNITLITPTTLSALSYTPAPSALSLTNGNTLSAVTVTPLDANGNPAGQAQNLVSSGTAGSVTSTVTSGQLSGLVTVRDSIIPSILSQLDQLSANLRDGVNAISNNGSSTPPQASLTGQRLVSGNTTSQYSGTVQIAVLDSDGNPITSPYADETNGLAPVTLNLSDITGASGTAGTLSVDDIINTINQNFTPQNKAELGNLNNIQLGMVSNNVSTTTNGTVQMDFNVNNISGSNAQFFVTGATVLDSNGNVVSTANPTVSSPSVAISGYTTNGTDNTVSFSTTGTNNLAVGQTIYIPAITSPAPTVSALGTGAYYTITGTTANSFTVSVAGASAAGNATNTLSTPISAIESSTTVGTNSTVSTGSSGTLTVNLTGTDSPYYMVQANVATIDSSGNVVTSTISYRVNNNAQNVSNQLVGASSATGSATIVNPTSSQPLLTATLVDANGNPIPKVNGVYASASGYLKLTAANGDTVAINSQDSKQLGFPNAATPIAGTNQNFSQYFALNNVFNANNPTSTGDAVANSAINLSVNSTLVNDPSALTMGSLTQNTQSTQTGAAPNYTYSVASGANDIVQEMAALSTSLSSFKAAGGLPSSSTTFAGYAGQIIANTSTNSTNATSTSTDSQTLLTNYTSRVQTVSGVNLDQELANTVVYQNAYTASTRIITVVDQLFTQLMSSIQ